MSKSAGAEDASNFDASINLVRGRALRAPAQANKACSEACEEWQREIVRFATARLQADSLHIQKLSACWSWTDAAALANLGTSLAELPAKPSADSE
jgi:hypothetical protein